MPGRGLAEPISSGFVYLWRVIHFLMSMKKKLKVVVLGAGFGGLELATILSNILKDQLDLTLIDKNPAFYFGYSKLDVMFGRRWSSSVHHAYRAISKQGVRFSQENIHSIDPVKRRVITDSGKHDADVLVVALGADYDIHATPGLSDGGIEFYSYQGAEKARDALQSFTGGHVLIGVCGFPFKCPPAPSETALLLHEYLKKKGIRSSCKISLVLPFELPIPPSLGASKALLKSFREHHIHFIPEIMVGAIDPEKNLAELDDGREIPFDLFLGIPEHRVPRVVEESGLVFDEWVPVDKKHLKTKFEGVYAIGDVSNAGTPKSGLFARSAAEAAAESIIAAYRGYQNPSPYSGKGSCYMEFGFGQVGLAEVDFFSNRVAVGSYTKASLKLAEEKKQLEEHLTQRWFGH